MNVFVSPLEVVNYPFVSQLLLYNEQGLEKLNDSLIDVEVIELCDHRLLIFQVFLVVVDQGVPFINYRPNVVESLLVEILLERREGVVESLVFSFLPLQFVVHSLYDVVVTFELAQNHLLIGSLLEFALDLVEVLLNLG